MQLCRYLQLILTLAVLSFRRVAALPVQHTDTNHNITRPDVLHLQSTSMKHLSDAATSSSGVFGEHEEILLERALGRIGLAGHRGAGASDDKPAGSNVTLKKRESVFSNSPHVLELNALSRKNVIGKDGLQPLLYYQRHVDHSHRRLAAMTNATSTIVKRQLVVGDKLESIEGYEDLASDTERTELAAAELLDNSQGFNKFELNALIIGGTTPGPENVANVLGLDIQSNDIGYFTDVLLGTPPRPFRMLVDSGSADTWVPSQACSSCGNHARLGSRTSSSFIASDTAFQVVYGSGAVEGAIVQDNIRIGNLTLEGATFGVTTFESPEFGADDVIFDGLLGTAQSALANQRTLTPIEALGRSGAIASSAMGYALGRVADGFNDGTVTFGGINIAQIDGDLLEIPNVSKVGFWEAAVEDATVNNQSLGLLGRSAILDTALIIMPSHDAAAFHAAIPGSRSDGQGGFVIPCTTDAAIAIVIGGQSFAINPKDLPFIPLDPIDLQGECQSSISAGAFGRPTQWLIGDVFLKSVYFATEVESNTIGIGRRKRSAKSQEWNSLSAVH